VKFKVNQALQGLLEKHRIFRSSTPGEQWNIGDLIVVDDRALIEPYTHITSGNIVPRRMGAFSYTFSKLELYMDIGRYCSIAPGVTTMGSAHPAEWVSTSPFSFFPNPILGFDAYYKDIGAESPPPFHFAQTAPRLDIGHDVWIGAQTLLRRDITIGTGAVIGARTVITKDIPAYAIVVGSPARIIRYRFSEKIIERLLALEWWNYGPDILHSLDVRDPEGFISRMEDRVASGGSALDLQSLSVAAMRAVYPPTPHGVAP
jgi:acetyltransferase-like isoleucine patch superfamily enzyme